MGRYSLGVVDVVYANEPSVELRARMARDDGFEHYDAMVDIAPSSLALPVGCPIAFPKPWPGWCATPAPARGDGMWERAVRWWRDAPGALLEPWAGAVVHDVETVRAFRDEVGDVRLLIDTGHVADWGGDPCELLDLADHVQLRQGAPGRAQLPVDDPAGVVDFAAVIARLDALGYRGKLSVEYFDLPDQGWALDDPRSHAVDLAAHIRPLLL